MKSEDMKQIIAYVLVSVLAVGGAFALSMRFVGKLRAQEPPAAQSPAKGNAAAVPSPASKEEAPLPAASSGGGLGTSSGLAELEGFLEPFIYDIANRRDPFLAFAEFIPQEEGPVRALTPAQRFALEELRLVGVMWEVKDPKAMFMDPDDEVLVLGRDESIGNRNGYIAAIREGEVVVVEAIRKRGDIIYRTRVLRIER